MKAQLFILSLLISNVALAQEPTVGLTKYTGQASGEYTFFCPNGEGCYLINECGILVHSWESNNIAGLSGQLLENGLILRKVNTDNDNFFYSQFGGVVELIDWDGLVVGSYEINSDQFIQHDDVIMMPNGHLLVLVWEKLSEEELESYGANVDQLWSEVVYELALIDSIQYEIVWEWHLKNHFIQDEDPLLENFALIEDNIGKVDINYIGPTSLGNPNRWHCNSIDYYHQLDQILINARGNEEFWIIDHSTSSKEAATDSGGISGEGGQLLFRWGNPEAYGRGTEDDRKLNGSYAAHWIPVGLPNEGKILYVNIEFDPQLPGKYSGIQMIEPEYDDTLGYGLNDQQIYLPIESTLLYAADESVEFWALKKSNAQQLSNGNIFINHGEFSRFFEVNPMDMEIGWEYVSPVKNSESLTQGDEPQNSPTFKAYSYDEDFPGFIGRDLSGNQPIEINPISYYCPSENYVNIEIPEILCYESDSSSVKIILIGDSLSYDVSIFNESNELVHQQNLILGDELFLDNLLAGVYQLLIEHNNEIVFETNFQIEIPEPLELEFFIFDDSDYCDEEPGPDIGFELQGVGESSYAFNLYNSNDDIIFGGFLNSSNSYQEIRIQESGNYLIEFTNIDFCSLVHEFSLDFESEIEFFDVDIEISQASGSTAFDGSIIAHITGGVPPYSYIWLGGDGEVVQDSIYRNLNPGIYFLQYMDSTACTKVVEINLDVLSSTNDSQQRLKMDIYPNPIHDFLTVNIIGSLGVAKINILDINGFLLMEDNLRKPETQIDVSALPTGVYLAQVLIGDQNTIQKFIKL